MRPDRDGLTLKGHGRDRTINGLPNVDPAQTF